MSTLAEWFGDLAEYTIFVQHTLVAELEAELKKNEVGNRIRGGLSFLGGGDGLENDFLEILVSPASVLLGEVV